MAIRLLQIIAFGLFIPLVLLSLNVARKYQLQSVLEQAAAESRTAESLGILRSIQRSELSESQTTVYRKLVAQHTSGLLKSTLQPLGTERIGDTNTHRFVTVSNQLTFDFSPLAKELGPLARGLWINTQFVSLSDLALNKSVVMAAGQNEELIGLQVELLDGSRVPEVPMTIEILCDMEAPVLVVSDRSGNIVEWRDKVIAVRPDDELVLSGTDDRGLRLVQTEGSGISRVISNENRRTTTLRDFVLQRDETREISVRLTDVAGRSAKFRLLLEAWRKPPARLKSVHFSNRPIDTAKDIALGRVSSALEIRFDDIQRDAAVRLTSEGIGDIVFNYAGDIWTGLTPAMTDHGQRKRWSLQISEAGEVYEAGTLITICDLSSPHIRLIDPAEPDKVLTGPIVEAVPGQIFHLVVEDEQGLENTRTSATRTGRVHAESPVWNSGRYEREFKFLGVGEIRVEAADLAGNLAQAIFELKERVTPLPVTTDSSPEITFRQGETVYDIPDQNEWVFSREAPPLFIEVRDAAGVDTDKVRVWPLESPLTWERRDDTLIVAGFRPNQLVNIEAENRQGRKTLRTMKVTVIGDARLQIGPPGADASSERIIKSLPETVRARLDQPPPKGVLFLEVRPRNGEGVRRRWSMDDLGIEISVDEAYRGGHFDLVLILKTFSGELELDHIEMNISRLKTSDPHSERLRLGATTKPLLSV